jgi:hypothetical protein
MRKVMKYVIVRRISGNVWRIFMEILVNVPSIKDIPQG